MTPMGLVKGVATHTTTASFKVFNGNGGES